MPARSLVRPYMPELDWMRGIAILMVLLFHGMAPPLNASLSPLGSHCAFIPIDSPSNVERSEWHP